MEKKKPTTKKSSTAPKSTTSKKTSTKNNTKTKTTPKTKGTTPKEKVQAISAKVKNIATTQKNNLKTKMNTKTKTKTTKDSTKKTDKSIKTFDFTNPNLIFIITSLILLIISYFTLGRIITILFAIAALGIFIIGKLIDKTRAKKRQRIILVVILSFFLLISLAGLIGIGSFWMYIVKEAPDFDPNLLSLKQTSILYDSNGNEMTKMGTEMRENITYDQLPEILVDAIIATEDSRFFQHNGFDASRFLKASLYQLAGKKDAGGASTLSMQVVKNSFTSSEDEGIEGIIRKFTDIYISIFKLEKNYTKEQIIEFYVNNHFLGSNAYGVEQASKTYFGKSAKDLTLSEAALIAGIFKAPTTYNPYTHPERAESRRATVLYLMKRHGYITEEEEKMANAIPVESLLVEKSATDSEFQGFIDTVIEELIEKYNIDPYNVSVKVYTTMDREAQLKLNRVFRGETFAWKDEVVESGVAAVDVHSGKILAIGAGRNKNEARTFNFATFMNEKKNFRQPGSSAKPLFDFAPGIEYNNWSTYTLFVDEPYSYSTGQEMRNWDRLYKGTMTLRQALAQSRNVPALKAFQNTDNKKILNFVQSVGIQPEAENGRLHEAHSIGAFTGVTPLQMAAAYATFANGGYYYEPYSVTKIEFRETGEVKEYSSEKKKVLSDSTAFMIADVLTTAASNEIKIPGVTIAAKTGTSNFDERTMQAHGLPADCINDSWTIGFSPDVAIGMWYGYQKIDSTYCSHNFPTAIERDKLFKAIGEAIFPRNNKTFEMPSSVVRVGVEFGTENPGLLAGPNTPEDQIVYEYFKKGTEPTEVSNTYEKIATPENFTATWDKKNSNVTLSWKASQPTNGKDEYGPFGYYIYYNDELLGFTEKTTYTIKNPKTPNGTYKIIASFKDYEKNQSNPATYILKIKDPDEEENENNEPKNYSSQLKVNKIDTIKVGNTYNLVNPKDAVTVYEETTDVTAKATITQQIKDGNGQIFTSIDTSKTAVYTITYTIKYKTYTDTLTRSVVVN